MRRLALAGLFTIALLAGIVPTVGGQEIMSVHFYLMPLVKPAGSRYPAHIYHPLWNPGGTVTVTRWNLADYGSIDLACMAVEAEQVQHDALAAYADVYQFPENIDVTMTQAQRSALESYLEAHAVPGDWIAPGDTFRAGLRAVTGMFLYDAAGNQIDRLDAGGLGGWLNCPLCATVLLFPLGWLLRRALAPLGLALLLVRWWEAQRTRAEWWR